MTPPRTIFFIGKPGCGKGTQARLLSEATGWEVIVCFDAGNMPHVARTLPKSDNYVVCADNDEAGLKAGIEAARILEVELRAADVGMDFNDVAAEWGVEAVKTWLMEGRK